MTSDDVRRHQQDFEALRQSEEALRQSEERLRQAQAVAHIGTFEWNIQTGVNIWTPELEAMHGLPPGGFPGTQPAWEQLLHPDDRAAAVRSVEQAFETGLLTEAEWRVVWPDGTVRCLVGRFQVFRDQSGKPARLTGVNIDVTEHKLADQERQNFRNIHDRKCADEEIRRLNAELEKRVQQRTAELARSNLELQHAQEDLTQVVAKLALPPLHLDLDPMDFRLSEFSLSDMMTCSGAVRQISSACGSAAEFARRLVQFFHEHMRDDQGKPALPLVRFFETRPYGELNEELRAIVATLWPQATPATRCLTLTATAGEARGVE